MFACDVLLHHYPINSTSDFLLVLKLENNDTQFTNNTALFWRKHLVVLFSICSIRRNYRTLNILDIWSPFLYVALLPALGVFDHVDYWLTSFVKGSVSSLNVINS